MKHGGLAITTLAIASIALTGCTSDDTLATACEENTDITLEITGLMGDVGAVDAGAEIAGARLGELADELRDITGPAEFKQLNDEMADIISGFGNVYIDAGKAVAAKDTDGMTEAADSMGDLRARFAVLSPKLIEACGG
ncbi:hypothetical protein Q9S36_03055 [Microbacterium sp. ARD31]|uniref:hypothetical protein n=1 Tax=Microbacterium sp. ARD31 TaxID=2962576 RepID=UPI002880D95E|nr:hypothetical protein [Microbacterium sp. ARD31]MDT0179186.1 hypothetical protein [Microbacterium sp. ARD31]